METIIAVVLLIIVTYAIANHRSKPSKSGKRVRTKLDSTFVDLFSMVAKVSKADGLVTEEEIQVVKQFITNILKLDKETQKVVAQIFNEAKISANTFEFHARRFYEANYHDRKLLIGVIDLLFTIAIADQELSAEEEILINQAIRIFGVQDNLYSTYKNEKEKFEHAKERNEKEIEIKYGTTLGLRGKCTLDDIRRIYRELVVKYHPDKVHHLGVEFQKLAEQKMKEINEAYNYFINIYQKVGLTGTHFGKRVILILEDELGIRRAFENSIKSKFGGEELEILTTDDGEKALRIIFERNGKVDLLSTDINHPGIGGLELAEMIKKDYPEIKIIICTGYANETVASRCDEVADHFFHKPLNIEDYCNTVQKSLFGS